MYKFETRVQRVRCRRKCKKRNKTTPSLKRVCALCGFAQKDAVELDTSAGNERDGQTPKQSRTQAVIPKSLPTPTTHVAANLQKLLTAKKRQSLNEQTGLLNFLVKSTT